MFDGAFVAAAAVSTKEAFVTAAAVSLGSASMFDGAYVAAAAVSTKEVFVTAEAAFVTAAFFEEVEFLTAFFLMKLWLLQHFGWQGFLT
jgi:hypothetical protein